MLYKQHTPQLLLSIHESIKYLRDAQFASCFDHSARAFEEESEGRVSMREWTLLVFLSTGRDRGAAYSIWIAEIGCTACARRIVVGVASERPRYLTFPALWYVQHKSVSGLPRLRKGRFALDQFSHGANSDLDGNFGIWTVLVVQIDVVSLELLE